MPKTQTWQADFPALHSKRMHEAVSIGDNLTAARVFAAVQVGQAKGGVFWIEGSLRVGGLCPHALRRFCNPARLIIVRSVRPIDALWCAEEALRSGAFQCVVMELPETPDLFHSRRLQLAVEAGGGLGLCLASRISGPNAAQTRWSCSLAYEEASAMAVYDWQCIKNKKGMLNSWRGRM